MNNFSTIEVMLSGRLQKKKKEKKKRKFNKHPQTETQSPSPQAWKLRTRCTHDALLITQRRFPAGILKDEHFFFSYLKSSHHVNKHGSVSKNINLIGLY